MIDNITACHIQLGEWVICTRDFRGKSSEALVSPLYIHINHMLEETSLTIKLVLRRLGFRLHDNSKLV